ncbi:hypothetical protein BDV25DRAFT_142097 [Aspergillus avenaceus]|uniref:Uncharacterized protein n=1 Tax=Aspergillus avenaceus TaxID=36643 RepID=A0A5N6TPN5_ASPAV|nr:hypothetical protein BDV25DRAFT_142097 [Aspergillus avenaceus]
MATAYHPLLGESNAFRRARNRSQTTVRLPPPSPEKKRASSYYPPRESEIGNETSADPFYLENSLDDAAWRPYRPGARDVRFSEEANQYYILPTLNSSKELPLPSSVRGGNSRRRPTVNRSTLSVVELEHQLALQQLAAQPWGQNSHYSQGSFGSVLTEATPDLTPSSSFSSNYSAPIYPEATLRTSERFSRNSQKDVITGHQVYLNSPNRSRTALPAQPSTPTRPGSFQTAPSNASSDTLVMPQPDLQDPSSLRGKPLPSLPGAARHGNTVAHRRALAGGTKPPIEPSMISPPCRINPVTMEPHGTHFDQALFISTNNGPSPVPSPGPNSPCTDRPATSGRDRPSTAATEVICEQSVWESDSDTEDADPKSLSRKPIDTLKKVRSRVHLRVAKSAPKLQSSSHNTQALEKFPTMPERPPDDRFPPTARSIKQARATGDVFRPSTLQTLRIVDPSTTSLPRPRTPRSRRNSKDEPVNYDIDRSTAAAIQAKSRRKQRCHSPQTSSEADRLCTLCREDRSDRAIHHSLTLARPPLYKRVWESLRVLGCHGDLSPHRPRKSM